MQMGQHRGIRPCTSSHRTKGQLLVLGYQATLQADPGWTSANSHAEPLAPPLPAPLMDEFLEPVLAVALRLLESRVTGSQRVFAGLPVPLDGLTSVLEQRLTGIFTQALAACLETDDSFPASTYGDIICKFPILSRLMRRAEAEWADAVVAFLGRLQHDAPGFPAWLGVERLPPIALLSATTADLHPGGHFGIRIVFDGGLCLYYKPRPVTGEWLWGGLLDAIAEGDPALRLPAARVLAGRRAGQYGWAESVLPYEFVDPTRGATVRTGDHDFWHAAGATLCLAQHVRLTDLHLGNILATPCGPAITDAECLASPQLTLSESGEAEASRALSALLDTGLLPRKSPTGFPDASGLFGTAAPVPRITLPTWALDSGGKWRLQPAPAVLLDHGNAPACTSPVAVLPQLLAGYRHGAEVLRSVRSGLLDSGSSWRKVLETSHAPRTIVRDTLRYAMMLSRSLEPACLASAPRRAASLLDALRDEVPDALAPAIVRAESHALQHLHIPRFVVPPGTRTLTTGAGRALARNFCTAAPADAVVKQMEELSTQRLESVQIPALLLAILG